MEKRKVWITAVSNDNGIILKRVEERRFEAVCPHCGYAEERPENETPVGCFCALCGRAMEFYE